MFLYNLPILMTDFCLKGKSGIRNVLFSHPYVEIEEMGVGTLHPGVFYGCVYCFKSDGEPEEGVKVWWL